MGTRAITHIHEMNSLNSRVICSFYRGFDGYPSAHGKDLKKFLDGIRLKNGIGADFNKDTDFNRAGSMAIDMMYTIKNISSIETVPTNEDETQEFTYHIYYDEKEGFSIKTLAYEKEITHLIKDFKPEELDDFFFADDDE